MIKECGTGKGSVVSKAAGDKWKAMSDVQKKPFNDKAAALKKEFEQAMEKFTASGGVAGKRRADKKTEY